MYTTCSILIDKLYKTCYNQHDVYVIAALLCGYTVKNGIFILILNNTH